MGGRVQHCVWTGLPLPRRISSCATTVDRGASRGSRCSAQRIEAEPYRDRYLGVVFDKWGFQIKAGTSSSISSGSLMRFGSWVSSCPVRCSVQNGQRLNGLSLSVVTPLRARGRVIPLLKGGAPAPLPASLRVRNWIDEDPSKFDESFAELIRYLRGETIPRGKGSFLPSVPVAPPPYEPAPVLITSSVGADPVTERLVQLFPCNQRAGECLFCPHQAPGEESIHEYCEHAPPFILREGRLFTFSDLDAARRFSRRASEESTRALDRICRLVLR